MRTLCASTLVCEFIVIGLAAVAAMRLSDDLSTTTIWAVSGPAMALCVLLCGLLRTPVAIPLGWALQIGLIAAGFVLPAMFILGAAFAGLWWASIHFGRHIDTTTPGAALAPKPSA
ncbi:DUF4233 domain-containing protein [Streptomyces millisiae]|uniref:DUF4233 domain-containing protein n=1 Tax=Streptomyces millisiae TaxID=3075542 RepID=A0ABU2LYJ7_9ACTN|nr:DUF4233 domain-containing protein [Streptomyces sp. DSM 44918]MDT0322676.1 DUF4233 domain-containing protein [Streptomyces sp. DSM 44918]